MHLVIQKTGKYQYLRLIESFRIGKGRTSTRVVRNYGRLDKLLEKDPDALRKLRELYSSERETKKNLETAHRMEELENILLTNESDPKSIIPHPRLNYGLYPIRKIWNDDLVLPGKINYIQKAYTRREYDVNRALIYLVAHKIIHPESVIGTFDDRESFVGDPARDISLLQFYDSLSVIDLYKDDIFRYINKQLDKIYGEDRATLVFYDVTNVYFESPLTDEEKNYIRADYKINLVEKAREEVKNGRLEASCFDEKGKLLEEDLPDWFWEEVKRDGLKFFLMRGPSKEHRNDLPLVSVALVVDNNGFPMDFEIYAGNVSEFKSMRRSIASLKKKYNIGGTIVVADRGLNSVSNLQMLLDSQLGFLVAQKVTQFDKDLTSRMLDMSLYQPIIDGKPEAGLYQVIPNWKKTGIPTATSRYITCTLVLTYNESRKKRDEAILNAWVDTVEKKAKEGGSIPKSRSGWASIAKTQKGPDPLVLGVDKDALRRKRSTCGFAAIVFKEPPCNATSPAPSRSGADIARLYHRLNNIEECFRIMKSNLGLRPVYVRTYSHVRGHIAICVIALMILKSIQFKLKNESFDLSVFQICKALRDSTVTAMRAGNREAQFCTDSSDAKYPSPRIDEVTGEILPLTERDVLEAYPSAAIMRVCGLTPLLRSCNQRTLGRSLGTLFPTVEDAVPACHLKQL